MTKELQPAFIEKALGPLQQATAIVNSLLDDIGAVKYEGKPKEFENPKKEFLYDQGVMKTLNEAAPNVVGQLDQLRPSGHAIILEDVLNPYAQCIDKLLVILLGLYFNGTPQPSLSQVLTDEVDRVGGLASLAHKMKAYGDVYRIERRRRKRGNGSGAGILTVVDHSIFVDEKNHLSVDGVGKIEEHEKFVEAVRSGSIAASALAERMARLYCTFQIIWYVQEKNPIRIVWLPKDTKADCVTMVEKWVSKLLRADSDQTMSLVVPNDESAASWWPQCVLNSREGVVRDWGQHLESQASRVTFSLIHHQMRSDIEGKLKNHDGLKIRVEQIFPNFSAASSESNR